MFNRLHVLLIPPWYPSQEKPLDGIYIHEQATALVRAGHQVGVVIPYMYSFSRFFQFWPIREKNTVRSIVNNIAVVSKKTWNWLPFIPYGYSYLWLRQCKKLLQTYLANYGMPRIIHVHSSAISGAIIPYLKKTYPNILIVITEHYSGFGRNVMKDWEIKLAWKAFKLADKRVAVSPRLGEFLEKKFSGAFTNWQWIPNLIAPYFVNVQPKRNNIVRQEFHFLNVASLTEKKGHFNLLSAFAKEFKNRHEIKLYIGGEGPLHKKLIDFASKLGVTEQVIFLGRLEREQVATHMQQADAFVLSSPYETFSVVLIEALCCGLPVIAPKGSGPDCIVNETNGILIDTQNINELRSAILFMYTNINKYDAWQIKNNCLARFNEAVVVNNLYKIYTSCLGNNSIINNS